MKILIGTPFYEVKGYSPYIRSLVQSIKALDLAGIENNFFEHSGDSYVDRAKNTIAHSFMESDYTHLFMIDSDLHWDVKGFLRLVKAAKMGYDVVGGAFPNKNNWETFGVAPVIIDNSYVGVEKDGLRLLEVRCMPGGFLIYSRAAFKAVQSTINSYYDPGSGLEGLKTKFYEYFRCNIGSCGGRIGEDVYFQNKFREAGGKILLEPNITFSHWGCKGWRGNYNEYLITKKNKHEKQQREKQLVGEETCRT